MSEQEHTAMRHNWAANLVRARMARTATWRLIYDMWVLKPNSGPIRKELNLDHYGTRYDIVGTINLETV